MPWRRPPRTPSNTINIPGDVDKFIALLVAAASAQKSRATVVLTVRADFYNPYQTPTVEQAAAAAAGEYTSHAAERPARRPRKRGFRSLPALVDRILDDVGTEEGRLPLLQFALKETWEGREGDRLTAEAYTQVGGVSGAIQKTAERAYAALTPVQQEAARHTPGEGREDTRARGVIPDDPQQRDVINLFSNPRTRLLVTGYESLQGSTQQAGRDSRETVEIAHEALIRRVSRVRRGVIMSRAAVTPWPRIVTTDGHRLAVGKQGEIPTDIRHFKSYSW